MAPRGGDGGARRPHLHHPPQAPLRPHAGNAGEDRPLGPVRHAGAPGRDGADAADPGGGRLRPVPLPARRARGRRPRGLRAQPRLPPARGRRGELGGRPKHVHFDRVEWRIMPDPATAAAALQAGEVDWWENPPNDLLPALRRGRDVRAEARQPARHGRHRHLQLPPPALRQAGGAPRRAARHVAGRLHDRRGGRRPRSCGATASASSRPARRWPTTRGWRRSPRRATWTAPAASCARPATTASAW